MVKRKGLSLIFVVLMAISTIGFLTACGGGNPPEGNGNANVINSNILDGKIANFMGATALAIQDKDIKPKTSGATFFSATFFNDSEVTTQKRNELIKQTKDGSQDVYFHQATDTVNSFDELNDKYTEHHHDGVLCLETNCNQISDEIAEEEFLQENTVVSLEARVNKLYTFENFTFMSVSSAVTGSIKVENHKRTISRDDIVFPEEIGSVSAVINYGNKEDANENGVNYVEVSSGDKKGVIFIKRNVNETFYHTTNYWSDDFNQSYLIDNQTGLTYSLAQFPQIYSVDNGIIKVYNKNADDLFSSHSSFDLYRPKIQNGQLEFVKVDIPTVQGMSSSPYTVKTDVYGNMIIVFNAKVETANGFDENGEKKIGNNMIFAGYNIGAFSPDIYNPTISQTSVRYSKTNQYHRGDDGRIYRTNFKGDMAIISLSVLDQNCMWQSVSNDIEVTFPYEERLIGYIGVANSSKLVINKIKDGYAYYSTASQTDGYSFWQGIDANNNYENDGKYCGVIKISVNGPKKSDIFGDLTHGYVQFEQLVQLRQQGKVGSDGVVLAVGETQMLCFYKDHLQKSKAILVSVESGLVKDLGYLTLIGTENQSIKTKEYGYLPLYKDIDFNAELSDTFTNEPTTRFGELDAYYKLLTQNQ